MSRSEKRKEKELTTKTCLTSSSSVLDPLDFLVFPTHSSATHANTRPDQKQPQLKTARTQTPRDARKKGEGGIVGLIVLEELSFFDFSEGALSFLFSSISVRESLPQRGPLQSAGLTMTNTGAIYCNTTRASDLHHPVPCKKKETARPAPMMSKALQAPATFRDCSLFSLPCPSPPSSSHPNDMTSGNELVQMGRQTSSAHSVGGQPPARCGRRQAGSPSTRSSWPRLRISDRKPRCPSRWLVG